MFNIVVTLLLIFFGAFASAQTDGQKLPKIQIEEPPPEAKHVLKEFQTILGGGDTSNNLKDALKYIASREGLISWAKAFNLKRGVSQVCRLYHIRAQDSRVVVHVSNLAFALPFSQAIEMLSGPVLSTLSTAVGLPPYITGAISVTGAIISLPGIDPICILIFASYPYRPVQNSLTWIREKTFSALTYTGEVSGITRIAQNLRQQWHVSLLQRSYNTISFTNDTALVRLPTGSNMQLIWDKNRTYFLGARFRRQELLDMSVSEIKDTLEPMPTNVHDAILELRAYFLNEIPYPFYIEDMQADPSGYLSVRWRAYAVRTKHLATCVDLLSAQK
jgi:hypothetical protein